MKITIDKIEVEVQAGETLLQIARRMGHAIPSLCYAAEAVHKSSCMVCVVKNSLTGQVIPSCTTYPVEGMEIETTDEEVLLVRRLSLELLLSDHRADCEAPCTLVCPSGLDIEQMLSHYDVANYADAYALIAVSFSLPKLDCDTCKGPCEKACRRGTIDQPVSIRGIIREVIGKSASSLQQELVLLSNKDKTSSTRTRGQQQQFQSRLGRFTAEERVRLKREVNTSSFCLHCACAGREGCKLRLYAAEAGIRRSRYEAGSATQALQKISLGNGLWIEPAKCIRCGLCVYNSRDGFTFRDRGFGMQVILPAESRNNVSDELAGLCPTGALYKVKDHPTP